MNTSLSTSRTAWRCLGWMSHLIKMCFKPLATSCLFQLATNLTESRKMFLWTLSVFIQMHLKSSRTLSDPCKMIPYNWQFLSAGYYYCSLKWGTRKIRLHRKCKCFLSYATPSENKSHLLKAKKKKKTDLEFEFCRLFWTKRLVA